MKNKKIIILIVLFAVLIVGAVFAYNKLSEEYTPDEVQTTDQNKEPEKMMAPDFNVIDKNGENVKLSDFKGKPVVINFWATWCGPCKSELPHFDKMYQENKDKIEFMMVNLTDGARETVEGVNKYIEKGGYTFPVFFDTTQEAAYMYSINSIPFTVFIDKDGYVFDYHTGAMNEKMLQNYIANLLKK